MSIVAACNRARRRRRRRDPLIPVSLPAAHTTDDHVLLCQLGPNICGRCKYSKFRRKWGESLKNRHQRDGQDLNPIEERVDPTSGAWTLGCQPCNVSAQSCAWGVIPSASIRWCSNAPCIYTATENLTATVVKLKGSRLRPNWGARPQRHLKLRRVPGLKLRGILLELINSYG